ncbi:MAG: InlB B-repeat-containing protein, partial [Bacteroidales bacterium]|nr:InlB B-repeat-containing protein [Candidatus Colicola coprequi]
MNDAWGATWYGHVDAYSSPSQKGYIWVTLKGSKFDGKFSNDVHDESSNNKYNWSSSADFTAQFYAKPKDGYSFKGWFDNASGTGTNYSSSTSNNCSYSCTLKATSKNESSPTNLTRYAVFTPNSNTAYAVKHYKQNVAGTGYDLADTDNLTGTTDTKVTPARKSYTGFTAPAGQEVNIDGDGSRVVEYYYPRNSYNLTWNLDGGTITTAGTPAGQVKYGATLSAPVPSKAGAQFNGWSPSVPATMPAEDIAFTAQWVSKYDFEMSGEDRSMKVDEELPNAFTFTHADNPVAHISDPDVVTYDAANNKLIAHQEGTTTIYFTQEATSTIQAGTSDTYTITVSKIANTLAVDDTHTMKIGETWTPVYSGKNSDAKLSFNNIHEEIATFDLASNTLTAHQAGTTTITFSQAETYKYTAASKSVVVTVNKKDNGFVWNVGGSYNWNQEIKNPFTSNNPNPITCVSNNKNIADYIDGNIYIYNVNGTATFTINQDATDIYNGINETRNVTVTKANNHVTYNAGQIDLKKGNSQTISFTGVPSQVSFSTSSTATAEKYYRVYWSTSASGKWTQVGDNHTNAKSVTESIDPSACAIKLEFEGGSGMISSRTGTFSNITITERREVKAHSATTIDFGECVKTADVKQETAYIDWYNVRPLTVSITGTDADQFEAVTTSVASSLDKYAENVPIEVKYKHTAAGTHTANLVVSNGTESTTITLKGTSKKQDPVITWKENLSPLQVNEVVNNPATAGAAVVKYECSDDYFLTVDNTNHSITAINPTQEGGITLKAYVEEDETWNYAEITCTIEITNLQRQIITWTDKLSRKFTETETISLTATSDAELPITYSLSGEGTYASLSGNQLTITGIGDGLYVTASQAGDETYYPAAMTKHLVVRDPSAACGKVLLADDYSEHTLKTGITSFSGVWTELSWNPANGEPGLLSCEIKEDGGLFTSGKIRVDEYYDGDWHEIQSYDVTTSYATKSNISIQRKSTKVRVGAPTGCTGTHYVKNIEVTQAKYAELSTESIDFGDVSVATKQQRQFTIHYSNLNNSLELALDQENTQFSIDKEFIGEDCGEFGTATVTVTYNAVAIRENETCTLTIKNSEYNKTIALKANVTKTSQTITWNPATTDLLTTDNVQFDATTSASTMGLSVTYSIPEEQQSIATIDASTGQLTIYTAGKISVTVSQEGSDLISPAVPVSKTFTITREIPDITTSPVATTSIRPTTLADLTLQGGEASQPGIFVWTDPTTTLKLGEHAYSVTFIPTNAVTYGENIFNINIVLDNQQQYISWDIEDKDYYCGEIISLASACSKATANDATTGLQVVFTVDDETLASIDGSELTTLKTGTPKITVGQPGNLTYLPATDVSKTIIIQPNVFTGEGGDDDWNNPANWKAGVPTDETPDASVKGDLTIQSDHKVNIFTIESGASVTIKNGATLTIEGSSAGRETYGDIIVENGGKLVI